MSLIQIENLSHSFGDKVIFKDVSFRLLKGERAGLVGANGCGKSTFLNMLSGKLLYDEGRVVWASGVKIGYLVQHADYDPSSRIIDVLRDSFKPLFLIEEEILRIADSLKDVSGIEQEKLLKRMGRLQEELDQSDFYMIEGLIDDTASGLGFKELGLATPVGKLSGGQKIRLMLARLLLEKPDILLLDEPTNYLDAEHIDWLSGFLSGYKGSFILVSHDIQFLNRVTNVIWHIEFAKMYRYPGNYEKYIKLSTEKREKHLNDYALQQREIARMEDFIKKNIVRASTTKRAQSRQKALDKIERLETPVFAKKPSFSFNYYREPEMVILETMELEVGYERTLLPKLDLCLKRDQKVAVTGFNGIGKSTLLKSLLGLLPLRGGLVEYGRYLMPVYFEQEESFTGGMTALETVWNRFPRMTHQEIRKALARCGLAQEHIMMPVKSLSGGERSKVRLCMLMQSPGNLMVLDEPTNHLDRVSKDALRDALIAYKGAILLVCHEESFYADWVDKVWDLASMKNNLAASHQKKGSTTLVRNV